ncbi:hypothetical protein IFM89_010737 [Coptis chinensis]|uniref:Uncharacterized protein n=1 Tax=Coptis chinensis TaxID=261450 RepID=A0A835IPR8_9MAGN|nr:hypothetical protein IFM89_010737 [Coptis chinensis]
MDQQGSICPWGFLDGSGGSSITQAIVTATIPGEYGGFPSVHLIDEELEKGRDFCKFSLVGRLDLNRVKLEQVHGIVAKLWAPNGVGHNVANCKHLQKDLAKTKGKSVVVDTTPPPQANEAAENMSKNQKKRWRKKTKDGAIETNAENEQLVENDATETEQLVFQNATETEQLVENHATETKITTTTLVVPNTEEKAPSSVELVETTELATVAPLILAQNDMIFQILLPPIKKVNRVEGVLPSAIINANIETTNAFSELDMEEETVPTTQPLLQEIEAVT